MSASGVRVITDTRLQGLQALSNRFLAERRRVLVGVPAGKQEKDGTPIALIAAVHEFGSPERGIPERSFLRAGILSNLQQLIAINAASIRQIASGSMTMVSALNRLGLFAAGAVQKQIAEGDYTPLRPATIARKGSSKPLIDTASLRQSITYQIALEGEAP